jgi:hypothetical protein
MMASTINYIWIRCATRVKMNRMVTQEVLFGLLAIVLCHRANIVGTCRKLQWCAV